MNTLSTRNQESLTAEIDRLAEAIVQRRQGRITEDDFRTFRLHNGIYGMRGLTDVQMLRVRIPLGRLNSEQLGILAGVTRHFGQGAAHFTTRQDVQIYHVPLPRVPQALRFLAQAGLSTRETSGNIVRNVTTCSLAGVCPHEAFDVTPYARLLGDYFLRNPLTQRLPRKFKIALSGCARDCAYAAVHDLGALAINRQNGTESPGFRLLIGGGLGAAPRMAEALEPFTPAEDLLPTAVAIVHLFNRLGNRGNKNKARLKLLLAEMGAGAFRQQVLEERRLVKATWPGPLPAALPPEAAIPAPHPPLDSRPVAAANADFARWRRFNAVAQRQEGTYAVRIPLPGGDLTPAQLESLAALAHDLPEQQVRFTPHQNALLRFVPRHILFSLFTRLDEAGLAGTGGSHIADIVSCPGASTCALAVTRSSDLAEALARRLADLNDAEADDLQGVRIKINGCPNACAHHWLGDAGLCGMARKVGDQLVPHYQLYLGGGTEEGQAAFGRSTLRLPARRVPEALIRLLRMYRVRRTGDELFGEWLRREQAGDGFLRDALSDLVPLPPYDVDPTDYFDWGSEDTFRVEIGESECA
ncbi:MAG: nitrite/sulfite reductase [Chloroflexi bacterium]|nr:nitrite/sulfite reductase [Chloroflexota bacterium]